MNDTISKPVSLKSHDFIYWLQTWPYKHLLSWWYHLHSIYFIFCCMCGFVCDCLAWNWRLWIIIWFLMVWPCFREVCGSEFYKVVTMWQVTILVGSQLEGPALLNVEKNDQSHMAFFCCAIIWSGSFHSPLVVSYSIPPLSHNIGSCHTQQLISLLWHLLLNRALKHHHIIQ